MLLGGASKQFSGYVCVCVPMPATTAVTATATATLSTAPSMGAKLWNGRLASRTAWLLRVHSKFFECEDSHGAIVYRIGIGNR